MIELALPSSDNPGAERDRRARARAGIAAVDALLEILEQRHLRNQDTGVGMLPEWRRPLEASGLVVPAAVSGATTTILLHDRLLDWQQQLLHDAYPRRSQHLHVELHSDGVLAEEAGRSFPAPTGRGEQRWYRTSRRSALRSRRAAFGHQESHTPPASPSPPGEGSRPRGNPGGLTDREVDILRVVAEGLSNAEVARRLHVSEHTVAAHLRSIFRKTGAASRSAATRYAVDHRLA